MHALGVHLVARGGRRQHHPRRHREPRRARPGLRRLHGHAGDGHQRAGAAGRAGEDRRGHPGDDRDPDGVGGRAVHPPPRHPPPGEGPAGHLRGRHRQPVLLHRHRRRAPGARDRGRGDPQGDQRGRGLHRRSAEGSRRDVHSRAHLPGSDRQELRRHGRQRVRALQGQPAAHRGLQHQPARRHHAGARGRPGIGTIVR